jgi:hypothetical protein
MNATPSAGPAFQRRGAVEAHHQDCAASWACSASASAMRRVLAQRGFFELPVSGAQSQRLVRIGAGPRRCGPPAGIWKDGMFARPAGNDNQDGNAKRRCVDRLPRSLREGRSLEANIGTQFGAASSFDVVECPRALGGGRMPVTRLPILRSSALQRRMNRAPHVSVIFSFFPGCCLAIPNQGETREGAERAKAPTLFCEQTLILDRPFHIACSERAR